MPYAYLMINIAVLSIPLWRSFDPRVGVYKNHRAIWSAIGITSLVFLLWDIHFTQTGVWGFNPKYHLDFLIFDLPISEILFFLTVPYACIFSYLVMEHFFGHWKAFNFNSLGLSYVLALLFLTLALFNLGKEYTFWASLAGFLITMINIINRSTFMSRFYLSYLILMLPFILTNGILTGSFSEEPIVWYNDAENLGIRLMRIPLDDFIYNYALLLINITLFEKFRNTYKHHTP
ncbi:MAG: lycopene cyclase domain-containing protein [Crocinitomicaceae bacterium]|nr:lycopene cyclase domain-containing protein [Crocinitomicaceae bacterium]